MSENNETKFVFRLQSENSKQSNLKNTLKDWDESQMYSDTEIDDIESSNVHSEHEPTSIPSPFSRIALSKTAFGEVAEHGDKALAAYQKIVSDSLDVAEIFFSFEKWKEEFEIITWSQKVDLQKLSQHIIFHKTLKTFLEDDADTYNFDKMNSIYILKHKKTGKMAGATSPCTLFFSSPNDLSNIHIPLSNNHLAFNEIFPLYKRSWDFQKYLYTWIALNDENKIVENKPVSIFEEFVKYLDKQKQMLPNRIDEIENGLPKNFNDYEELRAPDVEVLGKPLYKGGTLITTDDLLVDKIIRLPYKIQNGNFFDGNLNQSSNYSYFLPISETFFKYYSADDLQKWIRINENGTGGSVTVQLLIPDLQQDIKKEYQDNGAIVKLDNDFDCMLFPNVKFAQKKDAYYRFGVFFPYAQKTQVDKFAVDFYLDKTKIISENPSIRNLSDIQNPMCKIYSLNNTNFDYIKISFANVSGFLLPVFSQNNNSDNFTFAVDIGTTNTHIEYKTTSDNNIRPFDIQNGDMQIRFLLGKSPRNVGVTDVDFLPALIGENEFFNFPVRTALSIAKNKKDDKKVYPFVQANSVIPYEKKRMLRYNQILTQLKWDSTEEEMSYFIDSLCFILRNKVVLNGGNLNETKIVWFYPLSMAGSRSKIIREKWHIAFANYFLGLDVESIDDLDDSAKEILKKNIIELPESIAPFLCYRADSKYKDLINNLVSIDIGGGSTDIVFIKEGKKAEYVTSFRFAANSIFGLGENITPIVTKYQSEIEQIIKKNDPHFDLQDILIEIKNSPTSDLASFFFSLSNNDMLKDVDINFNSMLKKDNDQKIVFVLFYAAIIYHTAQIMKAKGLPFPRHITFSGNGSRIINIVADKEVLTELSKLIFEKIYGEKYGNSGLDIIQNTKNPKEVTCKGGVRAADNDYVQLPFEAVVLLGTDNTTFATDNDTYTAVNMQDSVTKTNMQVKEFMNFVLDNLLKQKYTKDVVQETFIKTLNLNPQTLQTAKDVLNREDDLTNFTKNGINAKIESLSDSANTQIEETFFFYPVKSLLNTISNEINKIS